MMRLGSHDTSPAAAATHRSMRLRWAYGTAAGSKIATAIVQLMALPIAVRALGETQFAIYATLAAVFGWLSLANLGLGPGIVVRMAAAIAEGRGESQRAIISTAFFTSGFAVAFVALVVAALVVGPIDWLVPFGDPAQAGTVRLSACLLALLVLVQGQLSVVEAAQTGHLEQHRANAANAFGSVLSVAALLVAAHVSPTVPAMILAVHLPAMLARFGNVLLFLRSHPELRPRWPSFEATLVRSLVGHGAMFSLAASLGSFLAHQWPIMLAGRAAGASAAASVAIAMNLLFLSSGLIATVTTMLWPAVADSLARGDVAWARQCYRRSLWWCMAYASLAALVFAALGPQLLGLWLGQAVRVPREVLLGLGFYLVLLTWENVHMNFLIGMRQIVQTSLLYLLRAGAAAAGLVIALPFFGASGIFVVLSCSVLVFTMLPLHRRVHAHLARDGA